MLSEAKNTTKLALPIILGELAQMSLHIVDTAMVGTVSYKHLAAASLVMNTINIPFVVGIGITISVSQMVSMAYGKKDKQLVSHYFFNGVVLCTIAAFFISLSLVFGKNIIGYFKQDPEVVVLALPFMSIMSFSLIPMLLFMTLKQFTDGLEFTRTAMLLSLLSLPINIFLNWVLIFGNLGFPRLELIGAGYATLVTRTLMFIALLAVVLYHRTFKRYMAVAKTQWYLSRKTFGELLYIGIPSSLQIGMEAGAFAVSSIIIGTISAKALAAHQIALSCASFTFMVAMGLSQAGSIRCSNAFGNYNWAKIMLIGKGNILTAMGYGIFCMLLFASFHKIIPTWFNNNFDVIIEASTLLLLASVFQISDSIQTVCAGLLRGIKDVKIPTFFVVLAYWVLGLPIGYILAFNFGLGANGIWLGFIIGLTFSAITLCFRFLSISKKQIRK